MLHITDFHESEIGDFEQVMNINDFDKLDMGDIRTSMEGRLLTHRTHEKKIFAKPCFGYTPDRSQTSKPFLVGPSPIMALFISKIFQLLMDGRAPDHYILQGWSVNAIKVSIASKFLDNFRTFKDIGIKREHAKIKSAKGIHRYLAATTILSNYDVNIGNFGSMQKAGEPDRIAGIDIDASLSDCFDNFQGYFSRLKYNAQFSSEILLWDEEIDLKAVHNQLRNKVNFKKLLGKLDNACFLIEKNLSDIKLYLEKQEVTLFSLLSPYLDKHNNLIIFQQKPPVYCSYDKEQKTIKFKDGKSLPEKIFDILKKHVEIVKKSSKTLNVAAEICESKTEDCINLVEEYVTLHDKKDMQVGEVSHFFNWLEVNRKISADRISELKDKYGVSTANSQKASTVPQPSVISTASHPQTILQQTQPTSGGSQPITGSATPLPQTPLVSGTNNNLPPENQDSQPLNHFLGISPRGWIIIAAGAVVGALALYFLAPLILGATVAIDAQLGLMATGAVAGGVIGYFTDVAINKCHSEPVVQTA